MTMEKKKFEYKWVILVLCVMMNFVCLGFCSGNKAMYLTAVTESLNIPRSLFALNESCRYVASAMVNLFFGTLIYKFGVRKMVTVGFVFTVAAMLTRACASTVLMFCLSGMFMGIGLAFTTTSMTGSIVRRWFHKDIGKYTGIVFAANGVGGAFSAQIVSPMINEVGNPFGWRNAYFFVAVAAAVTGVIVILLMRDHPKEELEVVAASSKKKRGVAWHGIDFVTARKKGYFYLAAATVLIAGICLQGISSVYIAHLKGQGLTPEFTATLASFFALGLTGSKILVGWLYDRFGLRVVMIACPLAAMVAFVLLATIQATAVGMTLAFVFAVLYALAMPLETLVIPLIVNDLFGAVSYDKMLGIFSAVNYVGYAVGAPLVNLTYDVLGTYKHVLLTCGALMLFVCIAFWFVLKEVEKVRQQVALEHQ